MSRDRVSLVLEDTLLTKRWGKRDEAREGERERDRERGRKGELVVRINRAAVGGECQEAEREIKARRLDFFSSRVARGGVRGELFVSRARAR